MSKIKCLFPLIVFTIIGYILLIPKSGGRFIYAPNTVYANSAYPVGNSTNVTNSNTSAYPVGDVTDSIRADFIQIDQIGLANVEAYPIDLNELDDVELGLKTPSVTIQFTSTYTPVYLPIILDQSNSIKNGTTKFSIGGVSGGVETNNSSPLTNTIPLQYATDGYYWNSVYSNSSVRMIRTCSFYRRAFGNEDVFTIRPYYKDITNQLCWDHTTDPNGTIMRIVPYNATLNGETVCDLPNQPIEIILSNDKVINLHEEPCLTSKRYTHIKNQGWITTTTPIEDFKQIVATHPDVAWLIGNEPDNKEQDQLTDQILFAEESVTRAANGRIIDSLKVEQWSETLRGENGEEGELSGDSGPEVYAQFYKYMYDLIESATPTGHYPKLVFCQATYADDRIENGQGLTYCRNAYEALEQLVETDINIPNASSIIYALAIHEYLNENDPGNSQADFLNASKLENSVNRHWIDPLRRFECWAGDEEACKTIDTNVADFGGEPALARKPLWLTEFGTLSPDDPIRGDGYLYLGENQNEGLWGLQMAQHDYLYTSKRWQKAWWYVSSSGEVCDKPENAPSEIEWCIRHWVDPWTTDTVTNSLPTFPQLTTELASITQIDVSGYTKCSGTGIWSFQYQYTLNGVTGETPVYPCLPRLPYVGMPATYYDLTNLITGTNRSHTIAITSTVANNAVGERLSHVINCVASEYTNCPVELQSIQSSLNGSTQSGQFTTLIEPTINDTVVLPSRFIPYDPPPLVCKLITDPFCFNDDLTSFLATGTPTPDPLSVSDSCHIKYSVTNQWESDSTNGFTGNVELTNESDTPITTWEVRWAYDEGQQITSLWHGHHGEDLQHALPISVSNATWNETIAPAQTIEFGFNASWSGENSAPDVITLNGTACQLTIDVPNPLPPPLPPEQVGCTVTYDIITDWGTGFTADIFIQNDDSTYPINGWQLTWAFPDDQLINNLWEGDDTQTAQNVAVDNAGWNNVIKPNDTVKFGFSSLYQTGNTPPDTFYLNNTACETVIQ